MSLSKQSRSLHFARCFVNFCSAPEPQYPLEEGPRAQNPKSGGGGKPVLYKAALLLLWWLATTRAKYSCCLLLRISLGGPRTAVVRSAAWAALEQWRRSSRQLAISRYPLGCSSGAKMGVSRGRSTGRLNRHGERRRDGRHGKNDAAKKAGAPGGRPSCSFAPIQVPASVRAKVLRRIAIAALVRPRGTGRWTRQQRRRG